MATGRSLTRRRAEKKNGSGRCCSSRRHAPPNVRLAAEARTQPSPPTYGGREAWPGGPETPESPGGQFTLPCQYKGVSHMVQPVGRERDRERHRGTERGGRLRERERQSGGRERECRGQRERVNRVDPRPAEGQWLDHPGPSADLDPLTSQRCGCPTNNSSPM